MTEANDNLGDSSNATSLGLLERVKAKDQVAWERMVNLYTPLVDHWTRRAGLQDADAADVRQEVFLAVAQKIEDFHRDRTGDTFRGWLHRIAQFKVSDHWRKKRGGAVLGDAESQHELGQLAAAPAADSDQAAAGEETQILYRQALDLIHRDFEERSWQAFWRVVIDGQKAGDVAAELHMTVNAVYLAKGRVLARLREEFAGAIED